MGDEFEAILPGNAAVWRADTASIFGLWPDYRIGWVNDAYLAFARGNGGVDVAARWAVGSRLWDAVAAPLLDFYQPAFAAVLASGRPWTHCYECNSPDLRRDCQMSVYPARDRRGLVVVNSEIFAAPHAAPGMPPDLARYLGRDGFLCMCASCRRTRRVGTDTWDWVPALVANLPPNVTHGLCHPCLEQRYGDLLARARRREPA